MEFLFDFSRVVHGRGDLGADVFAEADAQTVGGDLHRGLGHAERAGLPNGTLLLPRHDLPGTVHITPAVRKEPGVLTFALIAARHS